MARVDAAQDLALIEPQRDRVIGLSGSGFPRGCLPGQDDGEPIEVSNERAVERHIEREEPCLMRQELAHGDALLAVLRELDIVEKAEQVMRRGRTPSRVFPFAPLDQGR